MKKEDQLFGKIALKNNLIDEAQLKEAMALLEKGEGADLASILVAKGKVKEEIAAKISAKAKQMAGSEGGGKAAPASRGAAAVPPPEGAVSAAQVLEKDYSHLAGQPLGEYLKAARDMGASDFHFQVESVPYVRLHGSMVHWKHPRLTPEDTEKAIKALLTEEEWKELESENELDFCYEREAHGRYRTNVYRQRRGYDIVFRLIPDHVPTLQELNLPDTLEHFTTYRQGIVLITGPAGCGKSATMAALMEIINNRNYDHILTVEDPIEIVFDSKNCNVNQRWIYKHSESFGTALRSALRADPDVIMVGEMRDLETISMAITAAETGHLVMATLHTTNAIRSIDRIIDVFPPKEQDQIRAMVSESIRGVVSQQLLPRADGLGRIPAMEILFSTPAVGNLIREGKTFQLPSVLQTGKSRGMCTMDDSIQDLLNKGLITRETAAFYAEDTNRFQN